MLEFIRRHKRSLFGFVMLGIVSVLMMSFGVEYYMAPERTAAAATINEEVEISYDEFSERSRQLERMYQRQLGENYEQMRSFFNIPQQAIDSLIDDYLFRQAANELGFEAGVKLVEQAVQDAILAVPGFEPPITREMYRMYLGARGVNEARLEYETRQELIRNQLSQLGGDFAVLSEIELRRAFVEERTKYQFDYVKIAASDFEADVEVNPEELENFFSEQAESYRLPRAVSYQVLPFRAADFRQKVEIIDDDLEMAYRDYSHQFQEPARYRFRTIRINKSKSDDEAGELEAVEALVTGGALPEGLGDNESNEDKELRLEDVLARFNDGAEFSELATEFSEDHATKAKGGDLGLLAYQALPAEAKNLVGKLEEEEVSEIIESDDFFSLYYLEQKLEGRQKKFEEVRGNLEGILRNQEAPVYARSSAYDFFEQLQPDSDFSNQASAQSLNIITTAEPLEAGRQAPGITAPLTEELLDRNVGYRGVVELGDDSFVVEVTAVREAEIPELEVVRDRVTADFRRERSEALAKARAEELLQLAEALSDEEGLEKSRLALLSEKQELGEAYQQTKEVTRTQAFGVPFTVPGIKEEAFRLKEPGALADKVFGEAREYYLLELVKRDTPPDTEFAAEKEAILQQEQAKARNRFINTLRAYLRSRSDIWIDPELLAETA